MNIAVETLVDLIRYINCQKNSKSAAKPKLRFEDSYINGYRDACVDMKNEIKRRKQQMEAWVENGSRPSPAWVVEAWTEEGLRIPRAWCSFNGVWYNSSDNEIIHPKVIKWRRIN